VSKAAPPLAGLAAFLLASAAAAQPVSGLYIGAGAMANIKQIEPVAPIPSIGLGKSERLRFDAGAGGLGSIGYGLGNGLRFEVEGSYRQNAIRMFATTVPGTGSSTQQDYGVMGNVLYDVDLRPLGIAFVTPYLGGGVGYQWSHLDGLVTIRDNGIVSHEGGTDARFAYQAIVGAAFPVAAVPGLALTAEYRFMGIHGGQSFPGEVYAPGTTLFSRVSITQNLNHDILVGARYTFGQPPPPPPPPVSAPPAVQPSRTYLVFFDWDSATLTDRARQVVAAAAQERTRTGASTIELQGNADRSGAPAYNLALSERRARAVAGELVRLGVPPSAITIQAFGDTRPLVPTAPGVREPQNRRVTILLHPQ
jgi:outer membrane protein OmpA-like peptidoglycan-associated protein